MEIIEIKTHLKYGDRVKVAKTYDVTLQYVSDTLHGRSSRDTELGMQIMASLEKKALYNKIKSESKKTRIPMVDISENLYPEDKEMVVVKLDTSLNYINLILAGKRNAETPFASKIMDALEELAKINIKTNGIKNKTLVAISQQLFQAA